MFGHIAAVSKAGGVSRSVKTKFSTSGQAHRVGHKDPEPTQEDESESGEELDLFQACLFYQRWKLMG